MANVSWEEEIRELAARLGDPLRWRKEYAARGQRNKAWIRRTVRRRGEILLAVPRPGERFLLHTKSTYPDHIYRLPGGGINPAEAVEHAARREMGEELGFDLGLTRFIGVVENEFIVGDERLAYPTYVLTTEPTAKIPQVMDPSEPIAGFRDATLDEIREVVRQLSSLPDEWQPWGQFRAAPHVMLLERLDGPEHG